LTKDSPQSSAVTFLGPGVESRPGVPLVANLRSVELGDHPVLAALRGETSRIAREALGYAQALASALPEELAARPAPDLPSLWECFQCEFARHSLAPALMNLELAQAAGDGQPDARARLVERRNGAWWLGGSGAREVVREVGGLAPGAPVLSSVWWRNRLLPYLARRAPRPSDPCASCPPWEDRARSPESCDVLFLGVAATTAPLIAHLARGLEAEGLRCLTVDFHYENSTRALREVGVRILDGRPELNGGQEAARHLRRRFHSLRRRAVAGIHEQVRRGELPAWLESFVQTRITVALGRDLPAMAAYRAAAAGILDATGPRLVVGFHLSPDFLAPLLLGAQLRGTATVCAQHGIRGPVHRNGVALPWDYLLAWGQYTVDVNQGLTDEHSRWVVTGNCLYDGESRVASRESQVRRGGEVGGGPAGRIVLAATQTDEAQVKASQPRWWLRGVAEACRALGARLLIQTHPAETVLGMYEKLAADLPATVQLPAAGERARGVGEMEVLVTRDSTVVYEAALAGKPALAIALPPYRPRFPLAEHGGAIGVSAYEEIEPALQDALSDGPRTQELVRKRPEFLQYHLGPQDHRATERTLVMLREAAAHSPAPG